MHNQWYDISCTTLYIYIYIYIYMCVCVCMHTELRKNQTQKPQNKGPVLYPKTMRYPRISSSCYMHTNLKTVPVVITVNTTDTVCHVDFHDQA